MLFFQVQFGHLIAVFVISILYHNITFELNKGHFLKQHDPGMPTMSLLFIVNAKEGTIQIPSAINFIHINDFFLL